MNVILDAHTLIWAADDPAKLSVLAADTLRHSENKLWVSSGTIWEISIKVGLGKLQLDRPLLEWINLVMLHLRVQQLPISIEHAVKQAGLPFHHRDPFDRLIAAPALHEGYAIVSGDAVLDSYEIQRIW